MVWRYGGDCIMSYTVEWITPIYDRTYGDIQKVLSNPASENLKGCYNVVDILRIENNTQYVMEDMLARKIIRKEPEGFSTKHTWVASDIVTKTDMQRIIGNVIILMTLSNPEITKSLEPLSTSAQVTYRVANAIERNLEIMKNQPELPIQSFWLELEHGLIVEYNASSAWVPENEKVTIRGVPYGEYAKFMNFTGWSGTAEDLLCIDDPTHQTATLAMPFRNVKLEATFETHIPRTLKLNSGHVCLNGEVSEEGPSELVCYGGDKLLIVATVAASGKAFWNWTGTQEALNNLTGGDGPSSAWLVMPDMDVTLTANYINAGQHSITIYQPTKTQITWHNYNEYVSLSPADKGSKYSFDRWSGSTQYLENIHQAYASFKMPDVNINFTPHYSYNYSYNTVRISDGTIDGQSKIDNAMETSGHTITANIPAGMGFDYWSKEGVGSFANNKSSTTTFYVGDGNAIITPHFTNLRTLTVENQNNGGGSTSYSRTQNQITSVSTNEVTGDYIFTNWTEDGSVVSSSMYYEFTMPASDRVLRANYRLKNQVQITINYGSHSKTVTMQERASKSITADAASTGQHFVRWDYSGLHSIGDRYSNNTSITAGSGNGSVTAIYENDINYHTLTVNNGSGSGSVAEGSGRIIDGNQAPSTYEFDYWEIISGNGTIDNVYSRQTTYRMGTTDGEVTAHYKPIPYFTVTVINGTGSGTYIRNSHPTIEMNPAPEGMQFLQWEVLQGGNNSVHQPLAENTYIENLTQDVTVKATYYVPKSETPYTLSITHKDGKVETSQHSIGERFTIYADPPNEGYEFRRWDGDTQYLTGENARYTETPNVQMPGRNIELSMRYKPEGATELFHVVLKNGELLVSTQEDPETGKITETWSDNGEFEEGSVVRIRAVNIPHGYSFYRWWNPDDDGKSMGTVAQLENPDTTLTVEDFDITLERAIQENAKYTLTLLGGGQRPGSYYENDEVPLYFPDLDEETIHYAWKRWSGRDINWAIANLKVKTQSGTTAFDPYNDGDSGNNPQVIIMPAKALELEATFTRKYRLNLINATSDGQSQIFSEPGIQIPVVANQPQTGKVFWKWSGDTDYIIGNSLYNLTITVGMPETPINLTALYEDASDPTDIGYTSEDLYSKTQINTSDITIISGTIRFGFIITDVKGHLFMVDQVENGVATIIRLTQKQSGGDV